MRRHKLTTHNHKLLTQDGIPVNVQPQSNRPESVYIKVGFGPGTEHWTPKHDWSPPGLTEKPLGELIKVSS